MPLTECVVNRIALSNVVLSDRSEHIAYNQRITENATPSDKGWLFQYLSVSQTVPQNALCIAKEPALHQAEDVGAAEEAVADGGGAAAEVREDNLSVAADAVQGELVDFRLDGEE